MDSISIDYDFIELTFIYDLQGESLAFFFGYSTAIVTNDKCYSLWIGILAYPQQPLWQKLLRPMDTSRLDYGRAAAALLGIKKPFVQIDWQKVEGILGHQSLYFFESISRLK